MLHLTANRFDRIFGQYAFKMPPAFVQRFWMRAAAARLKGNELLTEALAAWEKARGLTH